MNPTDTIPVVILAGGQGTRLGGTDKCLLRLGGNTILTHILSQLKGHNGNIYLNANGDLTRFNNYAIEKFADEGEPRIGPIGGLFSALQHVKKHEIQATSYCLILPGDCPFLPKALISALSKKASEETYDVVYAKANGRDHFVVALWSTLVTHTLDKYIATGQRSMHGFISTLNWASVEFDEGPHTLFNINTKAQLDDAHAFADTYFLQGSRD